MKKAIIAVVVVLVIVGAWLYDQNNKPATQTVQQITPAPQQQQQIRGAEDMRSLKIP